MTEAPRSPSGWLFIVFFFIIPVLSQAQPGATVTNLEKPKKYENRILLSEKTGEGKIKPVKKASQNLNTRYNFFFNAERLLNDILANARSQHKDNFIDLLPFYNYSLDATASQKMNLDSIVMRCNDAILLHDLRNDWVDDLYLMMGKAYFFRKDFDSAAIAFQYVNFAFQPRTKAEMGYNKVIGSNSNEKGNVYTISTKESGNPLNKAVGHTPARNESLIWLLRTMIETGRYNEADGLIATFRQDVNFPGRLKPELNELQAYLFYEKDLFDSSAYYLASCLGNAANPQERSRWEFLLAQMHENINDPKGADVWYEKAIGHTTDPILEAYARINQIRLLSGEDEQKRINNSIAELMKMVKKDKYEDYKHIIYYAAARMELLRDSVDRAIKYLGQSGQNSSNDPQFRNVAYLTLADLAYDKGRYQVAAAGYDSLTLSDPEIKDPVRIKERQTTLGQMMVHYETIRVEDSLLRIAAMPAAERNLYIKNLVRKLRKEQGLKEEAANAADQPPAGTSSVLKNSQQDVPADLFATNSSGSGSGSGNGKNDWYFYNTSMKSQGFRQFKTTWGNRPNVDNWRRIKAVSQLAVGATPDPGLGPKDIAAGPAGNAKATPAELTADALQANVPLTPELVKASNDSIAAAYIGLARILREKIGDCENLIKNNEALLNRYPQTLFAEEALFGLYYCYNKAGNTEKAKFYKDYMSRNMSQSRYLRMINDPTQVEKEKTQLQVAATATYTDVYNKYIEGDFANAIAIKKKADSVYGENYWTPQLLYIESIYQVRERNDSTAIATLTKLQALYPGTPMAAKAANMISVLKRRTEIESYLTNLDVERAKEEKVVFNDDPVVQKKKEQVVRETVKPSEVKTEKKQITAQVDSTRFKAPAMESKASGYVFNPKDQHAVVLLLNKVDVVYVNEARNAVSRYNREKYAGRNFETSSFVVDNDRKFITVASFADITEAMDYVEKARNSAGSEIFPWMPKEKYSFFLISTANLELLKTRKDINEYLQLLKQNIPSK